MIYEDMNSSHMCGELLLAMETCFGIFGCLRCAGRRGRVLACALSGFLLFVLQSLRLPWHVDIVHFRAVTAGTRFTVSHLHLIRKPG